MKIITNGAAAGSLNYEHIKKTAGLREEKPGAPARADRVNISARDRASGAPFEEGLRAALAAEAREPAPGRKIEQIKRELAMGTYNINPADIARRIINE